MPVEIVRRGAGRKYPTRPFKKIALAVLDIAGQKAAELSLALIGNGEMQRLNTRYRQKDYPTDVLSFPAGADVPLATPLLGDVIISVDKAAQQAGERGHTLDHEMVTLLIHGVVHLLGYDHERSVKEARVMKRLEQGIFRQLCERGLIRL
jgi:rRNA maturation RNase YbeY